MRLFVRLLLVMATLQIFSFGHSAATQDAASADEQAVKATEEKIEAAWAHNDADTLEQLWSDDYTFTNPSGIFLTKAQRLGMMRSGKVKVQSYSTDDEKIRIYGDTAVVTYRSTVQRQANGQEIGREQHRVMVLLVRKNGVWRAVAQQSTPILVAPAANGASPKANQ